MERTEADEWRRGWRAVLAAGLGVATGLSLFAYVVSLFIRHYAAEFGWSRGEIAMTAIATLSAGLLAPALGRLADRVGTRPMIVACTVGYALICGAMAAQPGAIWVYYVLYFLLVLFGIGTGSLTWTRAVSAGFVRSRGLALSVALTLLTFSAMAMPPILHIVIETHGWRAAWLVLGGLALAAGAAGLLLLGPQPISEPRSIGAEVSTLREAARIPAFWFTVIGMFLINIPSGGIMNQMAALIADRGFTPSQTAQAMSAFAFSVFLGRLVAGVCLDRFPTERVAFVSMAAPAIGCMLLTEALGGGAAMVVAGIALAGLSQGAEGDIGPYVVARRFGLAAFSGMLGALGAATIMGTAAGAFLFGRSFDATGGYDLALWIGAAAFLAGAICYLALGGASAPPSSARPRARRA
ncbi:MAG: MFS transporter [Alphaproteobacteria bacterium]|nr:MFS transporter [Alphaproteobacteria bacterium]